MNVLMVRAKVKEENVADARAAVALDQRVLFFIIHLKHDARLREAEVVAHPDPHQ